MQKKKLLLDIGLNAYEAAAYLSLLKFGVSEANAIYRDSEVPYGKIYTVLESLAGKGFVEVQASRPKKFRAVDPELALDSFFEKRKTDVEREMAVLKGVVEEAKQALKAVPAQKRKDEVFWTTAINESEIKKFATSIYGEVKKSVFVIPPVLGMPVIAHLQPEIIRAIDRGVKVRLLISPRFLSLVSLLSMQEEGTLLKLKKGLEIRLGQNFNSHFGVVDDSVAILFQPHPKDKDRVLSVVKIWDSGLAKNLREEFELMWNAAERLDLETDLGIKEDPEFEEELDLGEELEMEDDFDPEDELDPGDEAEFEEVSDPEDELDQGAESGIEEVPEQDDEFELGEDPGVEETSNPEDELELGEDLGVEEISDPEDELEVGVDFDLEEELDLEEDLDPEELLELKEKLEKIKKYGQF